MKTDVQIQKDVMEELEWEPCSCAVSKITVICINHSTIRFA
jgi:hypothetical protein